MTEAESQLKMHEFTDQQLLQASLYLSGELTVRQSEAFEQQLLVDVRLCEAVAEATRLHGLLKRHGEVRQFAHPRSIRSVPTLAERETVGRSALITLATVLALLVISVVGISRLSSPSADRRMAGAFESRETGGPPQEADFSDQMAELWTPSPGEEFAPTGAWQVDYEAIAEPAPTYGSIDDGADWIMFALLPDDSESSSTGSSERDSEFTDDHEDGATL